MTSLKTANRRVGSLFAVAALVLATITPGLVPAFASAAQVAERSVNLSTFTKGATGVEYTVKFTSVSAAGAVVVDFCKNSPLVEATCTAPVGFSVAGVTTPTSGYTIAQTTASGDNAVVLTKTAGIEAAEEVEFAIAGVTNATELGTVYTRIVTYNNETNALAYTSTATGTGDVDHGSAAFSINDSTRVTAAVLESMTFCVSGSLPATGNCGGSLTDPVLALGEGTTDYKALSTTITSSGSIYSQLSTNAAGGAVVNLKSNRTGCGGLVRPGTANCDILPAGSTGILDGEAKFGLQVATATDPSTGASPNGILRAASNGAYYNNSVFKLNYVVGEASGVTGPYGDPVFDTADAPVSDKNIQLTFGARANNQTPAGTYSADLSLIATGKF